MLAPLALLVLAVQDAPPSTREPVPLEPALVPTRLLYVAGVYASGCPTDSEVRARVVANLGADPFAEPAARIAVLVVEGEAGEGEARATRVRLDLTDADGAALGSRVLEGDERCAELVAAAALALAIALDPTRALAPIPSTPLPPPPLALPRSGDREKGSAEGPRVLVRDAPPRGDPLADLLPAGTRASVAVGGHGGAFLTPGAQGGVHLGAAWRGSWWGLGAQARSDVPAGQATGAVLVSALPCAHLGIAAVRADDTLGLKLCATTTAGLAWSLVQPTQAGVYLGVGARLGAEWAMADASSLSVWAQLEGGLLQPAWPGGRAPVNALVGATFELGWPQ